MTPLKIDKILAIHKDIDRVDIVGKAILFESALYAKMPDDMSEPLALAALDVVGAPAQARKLPHEGDSVLILGANGKSGVLCGWEAMKKVGPKGKVVGVVRNPKQVPGLLELGVYTDVIVADCTKPVEVMEAALAANDGKEYDLSICCVNIESCEMSAILPVRDDGLVYFFSMATSFTKAALGAEGYRQGRHHDHRQRLHQEPRSDHSGRAAREPQAAQAVRREVLLNDFHRSWASPSGDSQPLAYLKQRLFVKEKRT